MRILHNHLRLFLFLPLFGTVYAQPSAYTMTKIPLTFKSKDALGAFSGLTCEPAKKNTVCFTHTDRGPNGDAIELEGGRVKRAFLQPTFTPKIVQFTLDESKKNVALNKVISLTSATNKTITGLPNVETLDEIPVTDKDVALAYDPTGLDLEAIVKAEDGSFWMADEYGASIVHFSARGQLLDRFIPNLAEKSSRFGSAVLSPMVAKRSMNKGFEAIAKAGSKIYAFLQSPLPTKPKSTLIRVVEFDAVTKAETAEYVFQLSSEKVDKIGDAVWIEGKRFYVVEQDGKKSKDSLKTIIELDLSDATNILATPVNEKLESLSPAEWKKSKITFGRTKSIVDLSALGMWDIEKVEGISMPDADTILLVNDNDYRTDSFLFVLKRNPSS